MSKMSYQLSGIAFRSDITALAFTKNRLFFAVCHKDQIVVFGSTDSQYFPRWKEISSSTVTCLWWSGRTLHYLRENSTEETVNIPLEDWEISEEDTISANTTLVFPKFHGKAIEEGQIMDIQGILFKKVVLEKIPREFESRGNLEEVSLRERQEQACKKMKKPSPWVQSDYLTFQTLKTKMKNWVKKVCLGTEFPLEFLADPHMIETLSKVVALNDNQLPSGFPMKRAPYLLLNALVANDLYMSIISIFFENANLQTKITNIDDQMASAAQHFLCSPAKYLMQDELDSELKVALERIYQRAANHSNELRTRGITLKCSTLQSIQYMRFDTAGNKCLELHPSVHLEDCEDELQGRSITTVVHPLLQAYNNNGEEALMVPGVVWFDSKEEVSKQHGIDKE